MQSLGLVGIEDGVVMTLWHPVMMMMMMMVQVGHQCSQSIDPS